MFIIWMIFSNKVGAIPPGVGPYIVGILIWALGMSLGGPTGYAMNPARDLGPRIAHAILPIAGKGDSDWLMLGSCFRPAGWCLCCLRRSHGFTYLLIYLIYGFGKGLVIHRQALSFT